MMGHCDPPVHLYNRGNGDARKATVVANKPPNSDRTSFESDRELPECRPSSNNGHGYS